MAHADTEPYAPDFFDGETLEKIEALGVAAAKSIMAADKAAGTRAASLYQKADTNIQALCDVVRRSLADTNIDPFDESHLNKAD